MKTLNQFFIGLVAVMAVAALSVSCDDDGGPSVCQPEDYTGTWVGKYGILGGLITLPDNDTLIITFSGNTASLSSKLLGGETFMADYNPTTGEITIADLEFSSIDFGDESFTDVSVSSGEVVLRSECSKLFLSLEGLFVGDGTVDLPDPLTYPIGPTNLVTANAGFSKI
jgi:hypothetical protein